MRTALTITAALLLGACDPHETGPDLRITSEPLVELSTGTECRLRHHLSIHNEGSRPAYAVVLIQTGDHVAPIRQLRIQPGPAAGEQVNALVCWPPNSRPPWCVEARLQRFSEAEPADLNPGDNRWCVPFDPTDEEQGATT